MQFSYVELLTCLQMQHGGRNLGNGSAIGLAAKTPYLQLDTGNGVMSLPNSSRCWLRR